MGGPRKQAVPAAAAGLHGCGERDSAARFAFGRTNLIEECILGFENASLGRAMHLSFLQEVRR